ncbi:TolB family protein [Aggregatilinea lenta]|uniref:TolB family protein n=1 Tax=Aggregatilinea lenta TaxID=913108 RepID=UPI0013C2DE07|nr:WD40 repeat domain-containing protein [Aggregatilinea lenta]
MKVFSGIILLLALLVAPEANNVLPSAAQGDAGNIAIAGSDGNLYVYEVASGKTTSLTSDAVPGIKQYSWPTWSTDGQMAYFGVDLTRESDPYRLGIFVQPAGSSEAELVYSALDETFTYAYWSPADCAAGDCRDLAVLYTGRNGLALRRVRVADEVMISELGTGGPFYWDWSPDGQSMLWARNGNSLEIYDIMAETVVTHLPDIPGLERAIDWSPVDDRLLAAVRVSPQRSDLTVFDDAARQVIAPGLRGVVSFEWSPDGSQVAYVAGDAALHVVNVADQTEVTTPIEDTLAFFWSPDGSRIAYLSRVRTPGGTLAKPARQVELRLQWSTLDVATDRTTGLSAFLPSEDMLYYLNFYDQFARSHRLWSPDSRYLVYGEVLADGGPVVTLLDTQTPSQTPVKLMDGSIGIFSWD